MTAAIAAAVATQAAAEPVPLAAARPASHAPSPSFHEVLSALNPLQYLPVIGTIYRAVTGDTIPEAVRRVGSLIVSALMGGPIGVVINLATMAAEAVTGIDVEHTTQGLLHGESIGTAVAGKASASATATEARAGDSARPQGVAPPMVRPDAATAPGSAIAATSGATPVASSATTGPASAAPAAAGDAVSPPAAAVVGLSITAYAARPGPPPVGALATAEDLNVRELARIHAANAAYARVAALAP